MESGENHYFLLFLPGGILETSREHGIYNKCFSIAHAVLSCSKIHFINVEKGPVTRVLQTIDFRIGLFFSPEPFKGEVRIP